MTRAYKQLPYISPIRQRIFYILLTLICFLFFSPAAYSAEVTLAWHPNGEDSLAGYKIYYKIGSYGEPYDVPTPIKGLRPYGLRWKIWLILTIPNSD